MLNYYYNYKHELLLFCLLLKLIMIPNNQFDLNHHLEQII